MSITVNATLYVRNADAVDALNDVAAVLRKGGWTVINADVEPIAPGLMNGEGLLAEAQPASFILDQAGGTQANAAADVAKAIHDEGYYSIARAVVSSVSGAVDDVKAVANAVVSTASNLAKQTDPNSPTSPVLRTVQIVAIVAAVVVVGFVGWKAIGLAREVAA